MYIEYWQLDAQPFGPAADRRFYYPSESHQGTLLKLRYVVESGSGAAVLAGRSGTGKTLLAHILREQLPDTATPAANVVFPQMPARDLLVYLAEQLGAPPADAPRYTVEESIRRLEVLLTENTRQGRRAFLVIDEADLLDDADTLDTLRLLLNFEVDGRLCLSLVLVGGPGILSAIERRPTFEERVALKTFLGAFAPDETAAYVQHRLQTAGATRTIFDDSALETVHRLSHGVPRAINRLCDLALLIGYAEGLPTLTSAQIESVCDELIAVAAA